MEHNSYRPGTNVGLRCWEHRRATQKLLLTVETLDFGILHADGAGKMVYQVSGPLLGIMSCAYNLGAICSVPVVPYLSNGLGRRKTIALGSLVMIIGAFMQGFAQNGRFRDISPHSLLDFGVLVCNLQIPEPLGRASKSPY